MGCLYVLDGHTFQSEIELTDFLIENRNFLTKYGDIVFSRTSKANWTCDVLENKLAETEKYRQWMKERKDWAEDDKRLEVIEPMMGVNKFLSGLTKEDGSLLFPEFRQESYWLKKKADWAQGQFAEGEVELFFEDKVAKPIIDEDIFDFCRKLIEDKWKAQGLIGEQIHRVCQLYWSKTKNNNKDIRSFDDDFIVTYVSNGADLNYIDENTIKQTVEYCRNLQTTIEKEHGKDCTFYPEYAVNATTSRMMEDGQTPRRLLGIIDLLVVDGKGNTHVYDYKTSPHTFGEFNSAKVLTFKYQLATYNRILRTYGINSANSKMAVNPIQIKDFKFEDNKWTYSGITPFAGLIQDLSEVITPDANINSNLDDFLPAPTILEASTEKLLTTVSSQMGKWFPSYNFGKSVTDEMVIAEIKNNSKFDEVLQKYVFTPTGTTKTYDKNLVASSEAELFDKVKKYLNTLPRRRLELTQTIRNGLQNAIKEDNPDYRLYSEGKEPKDGSSLWFNEQMRQYCNRNWEIIESEAAENVGVILIRNKITQQIDVVKITTSIPKWKRKFAKGSDILTGAHEANIAQFSKSGSKILQSVDGNIEMIEAMLVLNNIPELFEQNALVGEIKCMNPKENLGLSASNKELLYNFNELDRLSPLETNNFGGKQRIRFATSANLVLNKFKEIISSGEDAKWSDKHKYWKSYGNVTNALDACIQDPSETLRKLNELRVQLENDKYFQTVRDVKKTQYNTVTNPEIQVYNNIMMAIAELQNINFRQQISDHDRWLENFDLFKKGLEGSYIDNPGNLSSETLNLVTKQVTIAYQNVRSAMEEPKTKYKKLLQKVKDANNFNPIVENTVGNQTDLFRRMTHMVNGNLLFVDPKNPSSGLANNAESEFLENVLEDINKRRFAGMAPEEIEQLKANPESKWYWVPLTHGDTSSTASVTGWLGMLKDKLKDWNPKAIKQRAILKIEGYLNEDMQKYEESKMKLWEMTNTFTYGDSSEANRMDLITRHGEGFFEHNLETLVLKYTFASEVEQQMNNVFPIIKAAMIHLSTQGMSQNITFAKDTEWLEDYVKAKIFNKSLINDKYRGFAEASNKLMGIASKLTLGFSPMQFSYQMLDGLWKDISVAWRKPMGDRSFGFNEFKKAYINILQEFKYGTAGQTKPELLNELYGINDMDMNTYVDRIKSDRHGLLNFTSSWMFRFASRPDFYNRMSIFDAQMMKDGTWDAHEVKNGKLVYNWKLDKRFEAYANNDTSNPKYKEQQGLYHAMAKQMVLEHTKNSDGTDFKIGDALPKAYTIEQSESYKSLSDMIYGYYSHEKKSMIQSVGLGALFMQFKTYWSGKKNQYLAPGGIKSMGNMSQYEENGVKYFVKLDENGKVTDDITTEDTGVPYMVWKGQWQEGIFLTLSKVTKDFWNSAKEGNVREGWKTVTNDIWYAEDTNLRTAYRSNLQQILYDLSMLLLVGGLLAGWLDDLFKEHLEDTKYETKTLGGSLLDTSAYIGIKSLRSSADDLNFMNSIFGIATDWTPISLRFMGNLTKNWAEVVGGDKDFYDGIINSASATRQTKYFWEYIKLEQLGIEKTPKEPKE